MFKYIWPNYHLFKNRVKELSVLNKWWEDNEDEHIQYIYGRRRCGKTWLFNYFAHNKSAVILTASEEEPTLIFNEFANQLMPLNNNIKPNIKNIKDLFEVLFKLGQDQKILIVIDEFTFLLKNKTENSPLLSTILQAIEQYQDSSKTKILLCSSYIGYSEKLFKQSNPLYDRFSPFYLQPVEFNDLKEFYLNENYDEIIEKFSITGGMPNYINLFNKDSLEESLKQTVLNNYHQLFNDVPNILKLELKDTQTYFSVLEIIAKHSKTKNLEEKYSKAYRSVLLEELGYNNNQISPYLEALIELDIIGTKYSLNLDKNNKQKIYYIKDNFIKFWFKFIFPYHTAISNGYIDSNDFYSQFIKPELSSFIAEFFEELCRMWLYKFHIMKAQHYGFFYDKTANEFLKDGSRKNEYEEIDILGKRHNKYTVFGECKWTKDKMEYKVLKDLTTFKIPAVKEATKNISINKNNEKIIKDQVLTNPDIFLFSKSGFSSEIIKESELNKNIHLITAKQVVEDLLGFKNK